MQAENSIGNEEVREPDDLLLLADAARKFGFDATTLTHRNVHGFKPELIFYRKEVGNRVRIFVSEAAMKLQPVPTGMSGVKRTYSRKSTVPATPKKEETVNESKTKTKAPAHDEAERSTERHVIYCFGRSQAWLEIYADSVGISKTILTDRVGKLLQSPQSWSVLGT